MTWLAKLDTSVNGQQIQVQIEANGRLLTFSEVISHWRNDADFRLFYRDLLAEMPFAALFWETPAITRATIDRPYQCMVLESAGLARVTPNPRPFAAHFTAEPVVTFTNLGGDAMLVVPCPKMDNQAYTHLAQFLRRASAEQHHAFFLAVGEAVQVRLGDRPLWLNTSGLGVHWLHVRLDSRPKYYTYAPYRSASFL